MFAIGFQGERTQQRPSASIYFTHPRLGSDLKQGHGRTGFRPLMRQTFIRVALYGKPDFQYHCPWRSWLSLGIRFAHQDFERLVPLPT